MVLMHKPGWALDQRKSDHGSHKRTRTQKCIVVYLKMGYVHTDVDIVYEDYNMPGGYRGLVFALFLFSLCMFFSKCEGENCEGEIGRALRDESYERCVGRFLSLNEGSEGREL